MTSYRVKVDGQTVRTGVRTFGAAKSAAKSNGPGAAVEAVNEQTGVSWTVGRWFTVRGKLTWSLAGPTS